MYRTQTEVEKQYEWSKKGKRYKTKYFGALKQLFGAMAHDKDCQAQKDQPQGRSGTDQVGGMVE